MASKTTIMGFCVALGNFVDLHYPTSAVLNLLRLKDHFVNVVSVLWTTTENCSTGALWLT